MYSKYEYNSFVHILTKTDKMKRNDKLKEERKYS
jgi:hypothetical protein